MKTFLQPLSKEEERLCIQALRSEDAGRKSEAKQLLIERNLRLVAHIARKYGNTDEDMEDLISIGTIGLIKAVDSFDPKKNPRLAAYAARCIDNELLMMLRSKKKTSREVSLFEPDIVEKMEKVRYLSALYGLLDSELTKREKEVLILRYGLNGGREVTQKEIGEKLGISRSYVSRIEKKALKKMQAGFLKRESAKKG